MNQGTDSLISTLTTGLAPVKPLRPPIVRALGWLLLIAALVAWPVLRFANLGLFALRNDDPRTALEIAAALLTGVVATVAAFHLSVPDRSPNWVYVPLVPLALWIAASGLGCLRNGVGHVNLDCLVFVLVTGVPIALVLFGFLRRARPIAPQPMALAAGLGAAGIAAFLLQFFHPFDVTVMDLGVHAAAVLVVLAVAGVLARRPTVA